MLKALEDFNQMFYRTVQMLLRSFRRLRLLPIAINISILILFLYWFRVWRTPKLSVIVLGGRSGQKANKIRSSPQQNTGGCKPPELQINDPKLQHFFYNVPAIDCGKKRNWIQINNGTLFFDKDVLKEYGKFTCSGKYVERVNDEEVKWTESIPLTDGYKLNTDFLYVECKSSIWTRYKNLHAAIVPSAERVQMLKQVKRDKNWSGLNVYILGFDSISHVTAKRKIPKTYQYLSEEMGMVFLNQYNIVGDGTPQAWIPILTGKTEEELPNTRKRYEDAKFIDVYPMIWKDFIKAGYATVFAEDRADVGMFSYRLKGFDKQPTDHYLRTFDLAAQDLYGDLYDCIGNDAQHNVFMRYAEDFFDAYTSIPKFAIFFNAALSHDDLNKVQTADEDILAHIKRMKSKGHLDNTLFVFMSDHGHRFAKIRETHQGQLEERLPMFGLSLPKKFRNQVPWQNLLTNADRLLSPFDIHPTLHQVLHWDSVPEPDGRSLSLFGPVPQERSCPQAGIETHWCACLQWQFIDNNEAMSHLVANAVIEGINQQTQHFRELCIELKLDSVLSSARLAPNEDLLKYRNVLDKDGFVPDLTGRTKVEYGQYQIKLMTKPGGAIYEATVEYDSRVNQIVVDIDVVSRLNKYGNQADCIVGKDEFLAKWCLCHDFTGFVR